MYIRQSTASQEVLLGPFLDDTDGKTAETALTIANTDIKVWKHGGTTEASKNSGGATHIAAGRYYAVLDATDTDTLGMIELNVHVAGALPVKWRGTVLPANVYDSLMLGSDYLDVEPAAVASAAANTVADALLKRDWTSVSGEAARSVLNALRFLRNKWSISGTTLTVTKEDDATAAWTGALTTNASAEPITGNDPS